MNRTQFRVWPVEYKPRYYNSLYAIAGDFSKEELNGATICVIHKGTIVGYLDPELILECERRLYNE